MCTYLNGFSVGLIYTEMQFKYTVIAKYLSKIAYMDRFSTDDSKDDSNPVFGSIKFDNYLII